MAGIKPKLRGSFLMGIPWIYPGFPGFWVGFSKYCTAKKLKDSRKNLGMSRISGCKSRDVDFTTWMSRWKLGSMVRINGLVHLLINGVNIGVITHFLTIDPNFQRNIQVVGGFHWITSPKDRHLEKKIFKNYPPAPL